MTLPLYVEDTTVRNKFYSPNNRPKVAKKAANYPSPSGEVAVVAEGRGVQMRVADFRTDGAIASPGSENMEPAEPTKARRRNYSSAKEIQDKG